MQHETLSIIQQFYKTNPTGLVVIRWATATGKTRLSLELNQHVPMEVISADSRQVYQYMDIGTDKITTDIRTILPHHCIDVVTPDQSYTAGQWKQDVYRIIPEIQARGKHPFIVWGTGLYIDMLYKNFAMPDIAPQEDRRESMYQREAEKPWFLYQELLRIDPEEAQKHHPNSLRYLVRALEIYQFTGKTKTELSVEQPIDRPILMIGLRREKNDTNMLINARIKEMFASWLIEEVQRLLDQWYDPDLQSMQGIGYKEIVGYLRGEYTREKAEELLRRNTHHLAKKQRTRFRRYILDAKTAPKMSVEYHVFHLGNEKFT